MEMDVINRPRVSPHRPKYQNMKRIVDLSLTLLALPLLVPVILLCALAIFIDTGRPIFFTQKRIGKGGRLIQIIKFRTLQTNLEQNHGHAIMKAYVRGEMAQTEAGTQVFKPVTAKQITRVGGFLRRTSLDEIPQLINVVKGEMSIVGPRPNVPWEVEEYRPWHHERLEVLPGITGLAQVRGRSSISFDSIARHDIHYIENQSLTMDLKIIWWTIQSVMHRKGAG